MPLSSGNEVTQLEKFILRSIRTNPKLETLAKEAKVSPATLGMELAKLQLRGFLQEDGTLTQKGQNAITDNASKSSP